MTWQVEKSLFSALLRQQTLFSAAVTLEEIQVQVQFEDAETFYRDSRYWLDCFLSQKGNPFWGKGKVPSSAVPMTEFKLLSRSVGECRDASLTCWRVTNLRRVLRHCTNSQGEGKWGRIVIFLLFIFYQPETAANQEISSRKTHKDCRVTCTNPSVCARCLAWMLIPLCVSLSGCLLGRRHAITYQMISHGLARRSSSANKLIQSKENGRRVLLSEDDGEQSETKETKQLCLGHG